MICHKPGIAWIILNWKLNVFCRPKTNTPLIVNTWIRSENPLFFYRDFEVLDKNNTIIAKASSKWVLFDINKNGIIKIPKEVKEKYKYIDNYAFKEKWSEKLNEPQNSEFIMNYKVQRRDIDTNHHVNNLYYLDYAYEALPEEIYKTCKFSNIEIMYKHEAKLGNTLSLFLAKDENNGYIVSIKDEDYKKIHAIIKLYK